MQVPQQEIAEIVVATSAQTWFSEIGDAERIEQSLWQAYEARFRAVHEESLAYRYLPATAEERAHVERFFPAIEFVDKKAAVALVMDCEKLRFADWSGEVSWSAVTNIEAKDEAFGGKVLTFHVQQQTEMGKLKLPLKRVAAKDDEVTAVIGRYYGRYLAAKAHLADIPAPPRPA